MCCKMFYLTMFLSIYLSTYLPIYLSIYLSTVSLLDPKKRGKPDKSPKKRQGAAGVFHINCHDVHAVGQQVAAIACIG